MRADAQRNIDTLLQTAMAVFATSGVDAPVREIAEKAGVGVGTIYRHFPQRSDLIAAVLRREIDACADAALVLAAEHETRRSAGAMDAALRGLHRDQARARKSPAFGRSRVRHPARLLPAATRTPHFGRCLSRRSLPGEVRADVAAEDLLGAVASLCMQAYEKGPDHAKRMVALLVDGLRYRASSAAPFSSRSAD